MHYLEVFTALKYSCKLLVLTEQLQLSTWMFTAAATIVIVSLYNRENQIVVNISNGQRI
jgi:hypothetical protein